MLWVLQHPNWKGRKLFKCRLFLQELSDQLVKEEIQKQIKGERLKENTKHPN